MNTPKEKRSQRTKVRIIDAARDLVVENGFEQLSLRGIARRVGYSPAALYEYFDSKDDIIEALCAQIDVQLYTNVAQGIETQDIRHPLLRASMAYIDFAITHPDDFRLLFFHNLYTRCGARELIKEQISLSVDQGEFIPHFDFSEEEMTHTVWSLAHGMAMLALCREQFSNDRTIHQEALSRLIEGLRS
jgi:AcrR family transcriptional regulator